MKKILIICTGNTCRSPMAEGIVKNIIGQTSTDITVTSMGLYAFDGDNASGHAIDALDEIGIDIKNHRAKRATLQDILDADIVYVMTQQHKNAIIEVCNEVEHKIKVLDISDPFGQDFSQYRLCRDAMIRYFKKELEENEE